MTEGTGDEEEDLLTGELLVDPADFLPPIRPKLKDESKLLPPDEDEDDGEEDADPDDDEDENVDTVDEDDSLPKGGLWWFGVGLVW